MAAQKLGGSQRLHGLTQTHVVGQNHTATAGSEHRTLDLVRKQFGLEHALKRIKAAPQLRQQRALQLKAFCNLVFPVNVVEDVAVHHRLVIYPAKFVHQLLEIAQLVGS